MANELMGYYPREVSLTLATARQRYFSVCAIMHAIRCSGMQPGMQVCVVKIVFFLAPWQAPHVVKMAISKCKIGLCSLRGGAFAPDAPPWLRA